MSRMREVTYYFGDPWSKKGTDEPPEHLVAFIAWAQRRLAEIPPEYRDEASIEIESEYESSGFTINVGYWRDKTPEETAAELKQELAREEWRRQQELEELRRLQAKYGA